jgi:hypothetical protein
MDVGLIFINQFAKEHLIYYVRSDICIFVIYLGKSVKKLGV